MSSNDISVIIPTYNCAQFICRAIDSVLFQEVNAKIIVVDDASTDATPSILERYASNPHITIIRNSRNIKLGASRNIGLNHAVSKFVFFLDSDDWLPRGALGRLLQVAKDGCADVVASGVLLVDENGNQTSYYSYDFECTKCEDSLDRFSCYELTAPAWAKLYRLRFIEEHELRFAEPYWHEDIIFTAQVAKYSKKYISISDYLYYYYSNLNSVTKSHPTLLHLESYFFVYNELKKFVSTLALEHIGNDVLYRRLFHNYGTAEFMPKFERYASLTTVKRFESDLFAAAKAVLGINGYALADAIYSLYQHKTLHS